MKACKVLPSHNGKTSLVCPYCGSRRDVNVAKFKNRFGSVKVLCQCQSTFAVCLERRMVLRKDVYLEGYCIKLPECKECSKVLIENISPSGIGFATVTAHNFRKGDKVRLKFTLDDRNHSEVTKTAIVRWVGKANHVGCEFCDPTDLEQGSMDLRFYLMF
ncbi:MAG: PilZ domain-containing protein [Deltaproteobacteria bacterium]